MKRLINGDKGRMKIIFDNEEQKEETISCLSKRNCPSNFGLKERCENSCKKCWEKAIEMEVK